jgi:hypothetical protein
MPDVDVESAPPAPPDVPPVEPIVVDDVAAPPAPADASTVELPVADDAPEAPTLGITSPPAVHPRTPMTPAPSTAAALQPITALAVFIMAIQNP